MTKEIGKHVRFQRIRRITGYLVGTTERFNNAKRAEESARLKHNVEKNISKEDPDIENEFEL